jgi:hypothetical protein
MLNRRSLPQRREMVPTPSLRQDRRQIDDNHKSFPHNRLRWSINLT